MIVVFKLQRIYSVNIGIHQIERFGIATPVMIPPSHQLRQLWQKAVNIGLSVGGAKDASEQGMHTTFVGIGIDFNNDLVEYVSKIKGSNYHSVHSSEKFGKLLDDKFEYMVTHLVYDLSLKLDSDVYVA